MRPIISALFTAPWTVVVTALAVLLAKITRDDNWVYRGEQFWGRGLARVWGMHIDVEGSEHMAPGTTYVIMSNHMSHADVPVLFSTLPKPPGFLAKKELAKIPFIAMALRAGGHILIDRANRKRALSVIKKAGAEVRSGKTVAVFPEGTRGDGQRLGELKNGGFLLARQARVPIVPVGISGTHKVLPPKKLLPRSSRVSVRIGRPIPAEEVRELSLDALKQRIQESLMHLSGLEAPVDPASESSLRSFSAETSKK